MTTLPPAVAQIAYEDLLREFKGPLEQVSGCDVEVETRPDGGNLHATYRVTLRLHAAKPLRLNLALLGEGQDIPAALTDWVDTNLRPFGAQLAEARIAAEQAWREAIEGTPITDPVVTGWRP